MNEILSSPVHLQEFSTSHVNWVSFRLINFSGIMVYPSTHYDNKNNNLVILIPYNTFISLVYLWIGIHLNHKLASSLTRKSHSFDGDGLSFTPKLSFTSSSTPST